VGKKGSFYVNKGNGRVGEIKPPLFETHRGVPLNDVVLPPEVLRATQQPTWGGD